MQNVKEQIDFSHAPYMVPFSCLKTWQQELLAVRERNRRELEAMMASNAARASGSGSGSSKERNGGGGRAAAGGSKPKALNPKLA